MSTGYIVYGEFMMIEILLYSHFLKIMNPHYQVAAMLRRYANYYVVKGYNSSSKNINQNDKLFAYFSPDDSEFRFHINQLSDIKNILDKMSVRYKLIEMELHTPDTINVKVRPEWKPKEHQIEAIKYLTDGESKNKLLLLQTGKGKGFISLYAITELKMVTVIVILSTYIEKWALEITEILNVDTKDIMVVKGSSQLKGLISLAQENQLKTPFIIISARTLQNFINAYNDNRYLTLDEYGISPEELYSTLKAGILLIDETHQNLHAMFMTLLFSHVHLLIGLTATLMSDNYQVNKIHKLMYPVSERFKGNEIDKYAGVYAMSYITQDMRSAKLQTTEWGSNVYSHAAYEKSILSKTWLTQKYLNIIGYLVDRMYISTYQPNDKLIVFASTIPMCTLITEHLIKKYPKLDVRRYCEDDPYENVIDPDIRVTTVISSGTGLDIPNLRVAIMTNSIASSTSNVQILGRLRKLPDRDVKFCYIYNENIDKQVQYHNQKKELFSNRVLFHKELRLNYSL